MWWSEGKTVLVFRTAVFVGLASVVTTIIYFTPVPGQDFLSCERECHELEMPRICRVKLTLEPYKTLSRECSGCPQNSTDCFKKHCITADGFHRGILTANRQLPGPNINVCENDIMVVDVVNRVPGQEVTLHWRGQPVKETPFMDGVAMVTQCAIPSSTTFQYKFRASRAGTHMWHAHAQSDQNSGVFGALVVRQAASQNPDLALYDADDVDHVVVVHTLRRRDAAHDALLINGRAHAKTEDGEFPPSIFTVTPNMRHRFRLVNAGGNGNDCPISVSVDGHVMRVIALDGSPIVPRDTHSVSFTAGERVDFVLHASQRSSSYLLRASTSATCSRSPRLHASAVLHYDAGHVADPTPTDAAHADVDAENDHVVGVLGGACVGRRGSDVCVADLAAREMMPEELRREKTDLLVYLAFGYSKSISNNTAAHSLSWYGREKVPYMNNLRFVYPSSPLLTQPDDVNLDSICNADRKPSRCADTSLCECVHVVDVPLDAAVELVLVDEGGGETDHTFHLHGYPCHVVGVAQLTNHVTASEAKKLDVRGELLRRNLNNPIVKDTLTVPRQGVAAMRFKADNPGYWLLANDRSSSLNVVFRVGQSGDTPATPAHFPTCGSWVGPDFFLI